MIELPKFQTFYNHARRCDLSMSRDLALDVYANMLCRNGDGHSWQYMLENYIGYGLDAMPQWGNLSESEKPKENLYKVYTDGSCDNVRSKIGGSGYFVMYDGRIVYHKRKGFVNTTNNRMELLAIASALAVLPAGSSVEVCTDSQYCIQAIYSKSREANKNPELVSLCRRMRMRHRMVNFRWVRGHNGDRWNEFADDLATTAYIEECERRGVSY